MKRSLALPVAALALFFALAGCGGDDTSSDDDNAPDSQDTPSETSDAGITKDDFLEQGNAICTAGNAEIAAASAEVDQADPDSVITFVTETLVPNVRGQIEDIRALGLPEEDADEVGGILDDADAVLDEVEADPTIVAGGADAFADVNQALAGYGLTACSSS